MAFYSCGVTAIAGGAHQRGARLLGAFDRWATRPCWLGPDDRRAYCESLSAARASIGDDDFAAAWAEGQAMTREQAVTYAISEEAHSDEPV